MIVQAWDSSTWWTEAEDRELEARWILIRLKKKREKEGRRDPLQYSHKYKVSLIRESESNSNWRQGIPPHHDHPSPGMQQCRVVGDC